MKAGFKSWFLAACVAAGMGLPLSVVQGRDVTLTGGGDRNQSVTFEPRETPPFAITIKTSNGWTFKTAEVSNTNWKYIGNVKGSTSIYTEFEKDFEEGKAFNVVVSGDLIPPKGDGSGPVDYSVAGNLGSGSLSVSPVKEYVAKGYSTPFTAKVGDAEVKAKWSVERLDGGENPPAPNPNDTATITIGATYAAAKYKVKAVSAPGQKAEAELNVVDIKLKVGQDLCTIFHDKNNTVKIETTPSDITADSYRIEIKWKNGTQWYTLSSEKEFTWVTRIAGVFKLRGVLVINGKELKPKEENEVEVKVQFPSYNEMVGNNAVKTRLDEAWAETLAKCTENGACEIGFWIKLNTSGNGAYTFSETQYGDESGVFIPPTEDSPVLPNKTEGATYVVSRFHTHTPLTYSNIPDAQVGPSANDIANSSNTGIPGILYDYVGTNGYIYSGHPKSDPAQLYQCGATNRRAIPSAYGN